MSVNARREVATFREEWLGSALSTLPADRPAAEAAITGLYRLIGLGPPRFHWVPSPVAALETVPPGTRPRPSEGVDRVNDWDVPNRLFAAMRELCRNLDAQVRWVQQPLDRLFRQSVRGSLRQSCAGTAVVSLRAAHNDPWVFRGNGWYTMQCVSWVAHYDALRRLAGVVFTPEQTRRFDLWTAAARSCGWWWPREDVCVVSERPTVLRTEVAGDDGEVRLHRADGPAIRYSDGWDLHSWHGTLAPAWVFTNPDVHRIVREANVEVRRCAIERIGWASFIDQAGLRLIASAPDPGNSGSQLQLYDMRRETRVLLAVNGSVERDGRRRRYGLTVPGHLDDPVEAAGWTYGLSAGQYSLLARRT